MKKYIEIKGLKAREILDSRGNPTVEVEITGENAKKTASAPSGASTGMYEALELRDLDEKRYGGLGTLKAVYNVNNIIAPRLVGENAVNQAKIDNILCTLDGTFSKQNLGANAILPVSIAAAKLSATSQGSNLYDYIGGVKKKKMPVPMINILNGGRHADNNLNIQEFMIVPVNTSSFAEGIRMSVEVYNALKNILKEKKVSTAVGDEGGFAPNLATDEDGFKLIEAAVKKAGYTKEDFKIAIDVAASEMYNKEEDAYIFFKTGERFTRESLLEYYLNLVEKYNIISIEDPFAEDDFESFKKITEVIGDRVNIVGDDLYTTNIQRLEKGIEVKASNSILIKLNQIGTLTETLSCIEKAQKAGYKIVISHRSGETLDDFICDLAVGVNSEYIKIGAVARGERIAKYNRLLKIEEELLENSIN